MDFGGVNSIGVIVCVILNVIAGYVWSHPRVFFKPWWKGIGGGESDTANPNPSLYAWTFLATFIEGVAASLMLTAMGSTTLSSGLVASFFIWLGFVATTNLVNNLFAGRGFKVWAIEAGNHLVYLLITGAILSVWR